MRWTRNDTEAYKTVTDAGERMRKMYEQYLAGQAYKDATQITPETQATYGPSDTADVTGEVGPSDGVVRTRYGLGKNPTQFQDTAPTKQQQRLAGVQGLESFHSGRGNMVESLKYGAMSDTIQANELQREAAGLSIAAAKRAEKKDELEMFREQTRDNIIKQYTAAKAEALKGNYGPLKDLAGSEFNNQLPGLDDGKQLHFIGDTAIALTDARGMGQTRPLDAAIAAKLIDHGMSQRLAAVSSKDWVHEREFQLKQGEKESLADYRKRTAEVAERESTRKEAEDKATAAYRDKYLNILGRKTDTASNKGAPLGMTPDGRVIERNAKGEYETKPIMVDGKPATAEQVQMFKKLYTTAGPDPNDPMVEVEEEIDGKKIKMKVPLSVANPALWREQDLARRSKAGGGALGGYKRPDAPAQSPGVVPGTPLGASMHSPSAYYRNSPPSLALQQYAGAQPKGLSEDERLEAYLRSIGR